MAVVTSYTVQRSGEGMAILNAHRAVCAGTLFDRLTGLYAFASLKGATLLERALSESPSWRKASKRWVLSIDGGITEPAALTFLRRLPRSEVRVPDGEELLAHGLRPTHRFHPKTLILERRSTGFAPVALMVGSANLTCNGLCFGHEHVISATVSARDGVLPIPLAQGINELEKIIASSTVIDDDFVRRYAAARPKVPRLSEEFEDRRAKLILNDGAGMPPLQTAALAAARCFWIDLEYVVPNRGPGVEGNQIDMPRGSRVFFGFSDTAVLRNSPIGTVQIIYTGRSTRRNLRFGNNSMDKLDLPIPGIDGPQSYKNQTLLFSREPARSFRLTAGTAADIASWKARSTAEHALFKMHSGREFGVF